MIGLLVNLEETYSNSSKSQVMVIFKVKSDLTGTEEFKACR